MIVPFHKNIVSKIPENCGKALAFSPKKWYDKKAVKSLSRV
jgi:hypothetical protein